MYPYQQRWIIQINWEFDRLLGGFMASTLFDPHFVVSFGMRPSTGSIEEFAGGAFYLEYN